MKESQTISKIKDELSSLLNSFKTKGSFARNFSYLFSSKLLVTLFGFVVTPILTRIYDPEAYGYFAIVNAIALNFASISCLSYDSALVIARTENKFYNLFIACISFISISSSLLLIALFSLKYYTGVNEAFEISITLSNTNIFLIYFASIIYALTQIQPKWNVRRKQFKYAASVGIISQLTNRIVTLLLGFGNIISLYGLIIGEFIGRLVAVFLLVKKNLYVERSQLIGAIKLDRVLKVLKEYRAYPKFILPSRYLDVLANQAPIFAFSFYFSSQVLGYYALAISMINLPIQLLSNALSPLILKQLNDYNDEKASQIFVRRVTNILFVVGLPFFVCLIFFSDVIFPFVFGADWEMAGLICSIISGYGIVLLIRIFTGPIFQIYNKESEALKINAIRFLLITGSLIPGVLMNDYIIMIAGSAIMTYILYWVELKVAFNIINLNLNKWTLIISVIYTLCYFVKFYW